MIMFLSTSSSAKKGKTADLMKQASYLVNQQRMCESVALLLKCLLQFMLSLSCIDRHK